MKQPSIVIPDGCTEVLLHACCAPCSSAIVEWLVANGVRPTIFYYNPNIWPREEYEIRKRESKRHAESLGIRWIDGDYVHEEWRQGVCFRGTRKEERGKVIKGSENVIIFVWCKSSISYSNSTILYKERRFVRRIKRKLKLCIKRYNCADGICTRSTRP